MDNLRSLNSSLPTPSSSRRQRSSNHSRQTPQHSQQDLLQAFKTAALSVTNLYRAAAADASLSSYSDGYRDALEDLVGFLDREDLGLDDGEGWRMRQYLAERLAQGPPSSATGLHTTAEGSEDEAAEAEEEKRARSSSPILQTRQSPQHTAVAPRARSSTPPKSELAQSQQTSLSNTQFTFQAGHSMQDMDVDGATSHSHQQSGHRNTRTRHGTATLRLNGQSHNRTAMSLSGSKRKLPFIDFFDITELGNNKDGTSGGSGGKRSRLS